MGFLRYHDGLKIPSNDSAPFQFLPQRHRDTEKKQGYHVFTLPALCLCASVAILKKLFPFQESRSGEFGIGIGVKPLSCFLTQLSPIHILFHEVGIFNGLPVIELFGPE